MRGLGPRLVMLALAGVVVAAGVGCSDDGAAVRSGSESTGSESAIGVETVGSSGGETITVYSGQHQQTVSALAKDFSARTGIGVEVRSGGEGELANQIIQEGSRSPADVFYAGNSPALEALDERGLLAPVTRTTLAQVPEADSGPTGDWVGVSGRSSVLVYNTDRVRPGALPASILDLAGPDWKGRIGFSPAETDFQPLVTAVSALRGRDAARSWLEGLKGNGTTFDGNVAIVTAVNDGQLDAGIVEHYYWYRLRDELGAGGTNSAVHYFGPGDPGALVAVSGAGVLQSSDEPEAAQRFLAYLVGARGQRVIATSSSYEYPLRPGVDNPSLMRSLGQLRPPSLSIGRLGDGDGAIELLQEVGLL